MRVYPLLLMSAALCVSSQPASAARVRYTAELLAEHNDNLLLQDEDPISANILRPGIDFEITQNDAALQMAFGGRVHYYRYGVEGVENAVEALLDGRMNWDAIPGRLNFVVEDSMSMQPVDTLAADIPGNRQRINIFSAGPSLHFRPGQATTAQVDLRYVNTQAQTNNEFDSSRVDLGLQLGRDLTPTDRLSGHVLWQTVDFSTEGAARDYKRSDVFARYRHRAADLELTLDAGITRLNYDSEGGDRNNPLFRLQSSWTPGDDHRFTLRWSQQYSDVAAWALDRIDGQVQPGESMSINLVVANASPFVVRQTDLEYSFLRNRWSIVLEPYENRLRYVDGSDFDRNGRGFSAEVSYLPQENLRIGIGASRDHNDYVVIDRKEDVRRHRFFVEHQFARNWRARLETSRYKRESNAFGQNAKQGMVAISVAYTNF